MPDQISKDDNKKTLEESILTSLESVNESLENSFKLLFQRLKAKFSKESNNVFDESTPILFHDYWARKKPTKLVELHVEKDQSCLSDAIEDVKREDDRSKPHFENTPSKKSADDKTSISMNSKIEQMNAILTIILKVVAITCLILMTYAYWLKRDIGKYQESKEGESLFNTQTGEQTIVIFEEDKSYRLKIDPLATNKDKIFGIKEYFTIKE